MGQIGLLRGVTDPTRVAAETRTETVNGNSVDFAVGAVDSILVTVSVAAAVGNAQFFWETKDANGNYFTQWSSSTVSGAGNVTPNGSIGAGCRQNESCGAIGRLRWTIGTSATFSYAAYGA